ncbi:hypothetical protein E2P42_02315 [Candidatus Bathyarchaeota archaeon]|nr:hypothetical protein E2P42_02315 [Candidatus Bathyarchaeota archaeon]
MEYTIGVAFLIIVVKFARSYNLVAARELSRIRTNFVVYILASKTCPCQFEGVAPFFKARGLSFGTSPRNLCKIDVFPDPDSPVIAKTAE